MLFSTFKKIKNFFTMKKDVHKNKYLNYLYHAYPSNHAYKITNKKLRPFPQLRKRYKKIRPLFPGPLTSFVDIGCSKGFFVFAANQFLNCERNLGIDVHGPDIDLCHWAKQELACSKATFHKMRLHELAERIEEFGGPFQTVLLLNTYQYLYFGSRDHLDCYQDHDVIFQYLKKICHGRIIFNNRIEFHQCQQQVKQFATEHHQRAFSRENFLWAARKYFHVQEQGLLGRYPLFTMDVIR